MPVSGGRASNQTRSGLQGRPKSLSSKPNVIELPVLFGDDNVIVVDKPAGIIQPPVAVIDGEASVASFIRDKDQI